MRSPLRMWTVCSLLLPPQRSGCGFPSRCCRLTEAVSLLKSTGLQCLQCLCCPLNQRLYCPLLSRKLLPRRNPPKQLLLDQQQERPRRGGLPWMPTRRRCVPSADASTAFHSKLCPTKLTEILCACLPGVGLRRFFGESGGPQKDKKTRMATQARAWGQWRSPRSGEDMCQTSSTLHASGTRVAFWC
jgi:hypothetical protein